MNSFFTKTDDYKLSELAKIADASVEHKHKDFLVTGVNSLHKAGASEISFLENNLSDVHLIHFHNTVMYQNDLYLI